MAAKRPSTTRKRAAARRKPARRRHPATRVRIPRRGPLHARIGSWLVLRVIVPAVDTHQDVVRSRKDAAILKLTHEGCPTCKGNGQIYTKNKKTGEFTGAKACPAKPTRERVSKWAVYKASRFGPEKSTGLIGWSCPCGKKEKPRYRDAKDATRALRAHEKTKHGGKTVGGTWYAQVPKNAATVPAPVQPTVSKVNTNLPMSDADWEKQNKPPSAAVAKKRGLCKFCTDGALYTAAAGVQRTVICGVCTGTGKATTAATP